MKHLKELDNGLRALRWETRFIYTLFLAFSFAGFVAAGAMIASRSGFGAGGIADYYAGHEEEMVYPKTRGELLEYTHFHLFSMPLFLFVQGHLFLLTRLPRRFKVWTVALSFTAAACHTASPWLITYVAREFSLLLIAARAVLAVTILLFTVFPLAEMWRTGGESVPPTR
jgi:flagellar biosynthesis protein FliR